MCWYFGITNTDDSLMTYAVWAGEILLNSVAAKASRHMTSLPTSERPATDLYPKKSRYKNCQKDITSGILIWHGNDENRTPKWLSFCCVECVCAYESRLMVFRSKCLDMKTENKKKSHNKKFLTFFCNLNCYGGSINNAVSGTSHTHTHTRTHTRAHAHTHRSGQ
jgi:hypothetical protein